MTIGLQTPGQPTDVTPDAQPVTPYTSVQGPAPDGPVVATDVLQAIQVALNVQTQLDQLSRAIPTGTASQMQHLSGSQTGDTYEVISRGLYRFVAGSTIDLGAPWTYTSISSTGVWISEILTMATATTSGLARIGPMTGVDAVTPNGKIPLGLVQNNPVRWASIYGTARLNQLVTAGDTATVSSHVTTISGCEAGDVITGTIDGITVGSDTNDTDGKIIVQLVSGVGGGSVNSQNIRILNVVTTSITNGYYPLVTSFYGVVNVAGTARIQLYVQAPSGHNVTLLGMDFDAFEIGQCIVHRP